jgi:outer membrane lipoprotein-sorting protein
VFDRKRIVVTIHLFALLHLSLARMFAQAEPATADQVITRYMEAVGADRFSSITTFAERGELYGNLTNFWQGSRAPTQSLNKEQGTFEIYFKAPNLRFSSTLTANKHVISLHGCDGRVSWYIDPHLERSEFKPKPGNEYDCETGFEPMPAHLRQSNVKMQLTKKKAVEGRTVWEVKVTDPKSVGSESYYFDTETYFLLRLEKRGSKVTYSDYRDVGGIKLPFTTTNEFANSKLVTTVREIKVNAPIDDARFAELQSKGGTIAMNPVASPRKDDTEASSTALPNAPTAPNAEMATIASPTLPAKPNTAPLTEVNFPNFTSCTIAELQQIVPELNGLKPARDQEKLAALLDKVGTKTVDIARHTPNLISREAVTELQQGVAAARRDYDYLILTRLEGNVVALNEFRVDLKTGDKFQTDEGMKNDSSTLAELERTSRELAKSPSGRPPASQGFASSWVDFYPLNRPQSSFRYLGEQKMDHQHTLVLAFAQKPQSVLSPALFRGQDKIVPMFLQGVAWVDASDFRIVRLRTDLLEPLPEVSLHRLTADVQFVASRIEGVASTLSLPREVMVTSEVGGATMREDHLYSEYRLFRAKSRIVLDP